MDLSIFKRAVDKKSETKTIRLEDGIPAVLYTEDKKNENIFVKKSDFKKILQKIKENTLSVTVLTLKDGEKEIKVLVKDIQYHFTTYEIIHLDFMTLNDKAKIKVNVPIEFTGSENCPGVKLGGVLRRVIRKLKVKCFPKDMPKQFELDVSALVMGQSLRLSDIKIPANVMPLSQMQEVAVVIAKR